jgi:uncharacterized membrane protein
MEARAKLLGHPIHQMLIVFPLGLLATAVVFDLIGFLSKSDRWLEMSFYLIGAGILTGLLAAIFGLIDFFAIPLGTRARRIGLLHGVGNVIVVALFSGSWALRRGDAANPGVLAYVLSFSGAGLALVTGWLGGELVDRLGIGVYPDANINAASSLSHRRS